MFVKDVRVPKAVDELIEAECISDEDGWWISMDWSFGEGPIIHSVFILRG